MGLSASQARFLQLTARRGNIEYEAQRINFCIVKYDGKYARCLKELLVGKFDKIYVTGLI